LLPIQRGLQALPRDYERFRRYLRTMLNSEGTGPELTPLLLANPMAKDHVTDLLDALLAMDADGIASRAVAEAEAGLAGEPGEFDAGLVVVDDLMGGWTNRYAAEFQVRFRSGPPPERPHRWARRSWAYGALWSSEPATERAVRDAMLAALHRMAYVRRNGLARTLRERMAQEGAVLRAAGCAAPPFDAEEIAYTREVLAPYLEATDIRTAIQCLFGDAAGRTLGFEPLGLGPCAGLALAYHDGEVARASDAC
jgi:hypothetical protein